jgi:hypothetical protein
MTFCLTNRLLKQRPVLTHSLQQIFHPSALRLPGQPLCLRMHLTAGKAAACYRVIGDGGGDPNCARPPSSASSCAVREHGDRPGYPTHCFSSRQVVTC